MFVLLECPEELRLPLPVGLLVAPEADAGVRVEDTVDEDGEQFVEDPESLRMGLVRLILEGGGFKRSATADDEKSSGFFSLTLPVLEELPSNTISGLFLPLSVLELCPLDEL